MLIVLPPDNNPVGFASRLDIWIFCTSLVGVLESDVLSFMPIGDLDLELLGSNCNLLDTSGE